MEISPANTEKQEANMYEVAFEYDDITIAHKLICEIGGEDLDGKQGMLERVYKALGKRLPKDRFQKWTRRRVRGFWHKESATANFGEVMDLAYVASIEKAKREERLRQARKTHDDYIKKTASIAAMLVERDEVQDCPSFKRLRRRSG